MIIWPRNIIIFSQELSATHFLVYKFNLSSEKSYAKKTLARQVIPLACRLTASQGFQIILKMAQQYF